MPPSSSLLCKPYQSPSPKHLSFLHISGFADICFLPFPVCYLMLRREKEPEEKLNEKVLGIKTENQENFLPTKKERPPRSRVSSMLLNDQHRDTKYRLDLRIRRVLVWGAHFTWNSEARLCWAEEWIKNQINTHKPIKTWRVKNNSSKQTNRDSYSAWQEICHQWRFWSEFTFMCVGRGGGNGKALSVFKCC